MTWAKVAPSAAPASKQSASEPESAPPVGHLPTSEPWSTNFRELDLDEQMEEIRDHVTKLRAQVATLSAELIAHDERHGLPPQVTQAQSAARGDMTGRTTK